MASSPLNVICCNGTTPAVATSPADSTDSGVAVSPLSSPLSSMKHSPFYQYSGERPLLTGLRCPNSRQRRAAGFSGRTALSADGSATFFRLMKSISKLLSAIAALIACRVALLFPSWVGPARLCAVLRPHSVTQNCTHSHRRSHPPEAGSSGANASLSPVAEQSRIGMRQRSASECADWDGIVLKSILKKPQRIDRFSR